ncbi:MAG TPA: ABC transporter permease, partial [Gemmataceae bacterium]|nr:ABC transporter permease [Gemmataceae bacterium]
EDRSTKKFAVVDRTADRQVSAALVAGLPDHNDRQAYDPETGEQTAPKFELVMIDPSAPDKAEILRQRYDLSQRSQNGEFEGFVDIGPDVYALRKNRPADERQELRFQSAKPGSSGFARWAEREANRGIQQHRFAAHNVSQGLVREIQQPVELKSKGLTGRDAVSGELRDATEESRVGNVVLPVVLMVLMYFMILVGATPAMHGVIEEKQQRISEVLLGSVSPFELMLGKLLGVVAVALTVGGVYAVVGYAVAHRYGLTELLPPALLAWFFLFLVLAVLTYASLFIAIGAAASDIKETQSLLMPVMLMAAMPMLLLGVVIQNPNGPIAVAGSFFPFTAPMFMTARVAMPPGIAWWQPVLGVATVLATVVACVWAAGRIFRVGLLMQGKGIKFADLARWVVRG